MLFEAKLVPTMKRLCGMTRCVCTFWRDLRRVFASFLPCCYWLVRHVSHASQMSGRTQDLCGWIPAHIPHSTPSPLTSFTRSTFSLQTLTMSTEESKSAKIAEVALITGCSSGIGLALARQLKEAGTQVYAAVRKETEELRALGVTKVITGIDVSDDSVVETLAKAVEGVKFDLVINNAGVFNVEPLDAVDTANMARQFNVNAIGPVRVFKALASNFAETGAKLVTTSSMMGSLALTQADPSIPAISYRISKAATNMWTVQAAAALKEKCVHVVNRCQCTNMSPHADRCV